MVKNRIVEVKEIAVAQVMDNPLNWREHPQAQGDALKALLDAVGFVRGVIINQRTNQLLDGHLRVLLAREAGMTRIPATIVDLNEAEERTLLALYDPIKALAVLDDDKSNILSARLKEEGSRVAEIVQRLLNDSEMSIGRVKQVDKASDPDVRLSVGTYHWILPRDVYLGWRERAYAAVGLDKESIANMIRERLGFDEADTD